MLDKELLDILVCPENKAPVAPADEAMVERLNNMIQAGQLKNRAGEAVEEPIEEGLVREDKKYLYPVREGIPIMLVDEAIPLDQVEG